jgi:hypothetical protein
MAVIAVAVVVAALWHTPPKNVLVLATDRDCARRFDEATCGKIVDAALRIHVKTAPRFLNRRTCELAFGAGECREIEQKPASMFVPEIAVILAAHDAEPDGLLPLHFGPSGEAPAADGSRRVYYGGVAVGSMLTVRFGGARLPRVADLKGVPMTIGRVEKLRKR